jgi:glycosyltransferase involved in cell wall biosynthesis
LRILQVVDFLSPAYGGPGQVVDQISKELVRRGHEVVIYATDSFDNRKRQKENHLETGGVRIHYFRNVSNSLAWHRLCFSPGVVSQVRGEIQDFDIIHLQDFRNFLNIVTYWYAKRNRIPYILQAHGSINTFFQKGGMKTAYDKIWGRRILENASRFVALTSNEAEYIKSMGIQENKITILPNGIDLAVFNQLPNRGQFRAKYGIGAEERVVLFLGRLNWIKGIDLLIKSVVNILKNSPNTKLVIAGPDDGFLPRIKELIAEFNIEESVLLTGPLYGSAKMAAYVDADLYVLPSFYESFSITTFEASACGIPVIVSDKCGIADIVRGRLGLVVPCDEIHLSKAISYLLNDGEKRLEFGAEGEKLIRHKYCWPKIVSDLESIYEEVRYVKENIYRKIYTGIRSA